MDICVKKDLSIDRVAFSADISPKAGAPRLAQEDFAMRIFILTLPKEVGKVGTVQSFVPFAWREVDDLYDA